MGNHLIQSGVRVLRLLDAHDLNLVELMQTVQTPHVLAIGTGLTTEARSVGGHLLREVVVTKDDISEYIGDRNLGCRDEIEVIKTYIVHLGLLVRQLTGTETGSGVDHDRRLHLLVAGGGVDVKEEVDEGPLEFRALALIDRKTGSGELHSKVEIYDVIFLGKLPVRESVLRKVDLRAAHLHNLIVLGSLSRDNEVARHIRKKNQLSLKFLVVLIGLGEKFGRLGLEFGHFLLDLFGLGLLAIFHKSTDLLGELILLGHNSVTLCLKSPSVGVQFEDFFHDGPRIEILYCQLLDHVLRIVTKRFECKHNIANSLITIKMEVPACRRECSPTHFQASKPETGSFKTKKRTGTITRSQPSFIINPPSLSSQKG